MAEVKGETIAIEVQRGFLIGSLASLLLSSNRSRVVRSQRSCAVRAIFSLSARQLLPLFFLHQKPPHHHHQPSDFVAGRPTVGGKDSIYTPFQRILLTLLTAPRHPRQQQSAARDTRRVAQPYLRVALRMSSPIPSRLRQELFRASSRHPQSCATTSTASSAGVVPHVSQATSTNPFRAPSC